MLLDLADEVAAIKKAKKIKTFSMRRAEVKIAKNNLKRELDRHGPSYRKAMKKMITLDDWSQKFLQACQTDICVEKIEQDIKDWRKKNVRSCEGLWPYNLVNTKKVKNIWRFKRALNKEVKELSLSRQELLPSSYTSGSAEAKILSSVDFEQLLFGVESLTTFGVDNIAKYGIAALKKYGLEAIEKFGLSALKKHGKEPLEKFGLEALEKHGLSALKTYGLASLEKYGLQALHRFGLKPLMKYGFENIEKYGLDSLDKYGLSLITKYDVPTLEKAAERYTLVSLGKYGIEALQKVEKELGYEALRCYGMESIEKYGIANLDKYGKEALEKYGLEALQKAENLYGLEALNIYGLVLLQKHTIEEIESAIDEYGIEAVLEQGSITPIDARGFEIIHGQRAMRVVHAKIHDSYRTYMYYRGNKWAGNLIIADNLYHEIYGSKNFSGNVLGSLYFHNGDKAAIQVNKIVRAQAKNISEENQLIFYLDDSLTIYAVSLGDKIIYQGT